MEQNPLNSDAVLRREVCDALLKRMIRDMERPAPILLTLAQAWSLVAHGPGLGVSGTGGMDMSLFPGNPNDVPGDL